MKDQFYKIKTEKKQYKGERYFRLNKDSEKVIQVCVSPGDTRCGKANTFGVYMINRLTFLSNYMIYYVQTCSQKEFEKQFEKVVDMLKT